MKDVGTDEAGGNICEKCVRWVNCGKKDGKTYGFCVLESLYTYTVRSCCRDYLKGSPMGIAEFEMYV